MKVTKIFNFAYAHYLPDYDGPCKNVHGHNAKLEITLDGRIDPKTGMVLDFTILKEFVQNNIIKLFDHTFLNELYLPEIENMGEKIDVLYLEIRSNPTAERMVEFIVALLQREYKGRVSLEKVKFWETDTSYVEWENAYYK